MGVRALRQHKAGGPFLGGLVAVVTIGSEAPGDGDVGGSQSLGNRFQTIGPRRQAAGGGAEGVGLGLGAESQQHAVGLAVGARQLERLAGLGLEAFGLGESCRLPDQPVDRRGKPCLGQGLDRDGGFGGVEQGVGHRVAKPLAARRLPAH